MEAEGRKWGTPMGYLSVRGMQEMAPLHCDLIAGEEPSTMGWGVVTEKRREESDNK